VKKPKPKTPRSHRPPEVESVGEYFFERGDPGAPAGSSSGATNELYQVLEWYHEHVIKANRWWRQLGRAIRRRSFLRLDPFAWIRMRRRETAGTEGGEA